jgi:predicted acyl esterase
MYIAQMSDVSGSVGSPWVHEQMHQVRPGGQRKRGDDTRKREKLDDNWLAHVKDMWSKTTTTSAARGASTQEEEVAGQDAKRGR